VKTKAKAKTMNTVSKRAGELIKKLRTSLSEEERVKTTAVESVTKAFEAFQARMQPLVTEIGSDEALKQILHDEAGGSLNLRFIFRWSDGSFFDNVSKNTVTPREAAENLVCERGWIGPHGFIDQMLEDLASITTNHERLVGRNSSRAQEAEEIASTR